MNLVLDEKFTADDKEENDTGQDGGKVGVQTEPGGDLVCTALHKDQKERRKNHHKGIELGKPGDHDGGKAASADQIGVDGMGGTAHQQKTDQTADGTRKRHGAQNDLFHIDTDITGGVFTLTDNRNFVSVFAVVQINVNHNRQNGDDDNIQNILDTEQVGKPTVAEQIGTDHIGAGLIGYF